MRVLLTGATGFLGSYVLEELLQHNTETAIIVRPQSNLWRIHHLLPNVVQFEGDLNQLPSMAWQIEEFKPEIIIHLAWSGVGNRYRDDLRQINDNLQSSLNLFRLARQMNCTAWIGVGSQAEYGPQNKKLTEDAPTQPSTLYGATKLATCTLVQQLCALADMRFVWLRLFSSYGPKDDPTWMMPSLIQTLLRREKLALTAGEQIWDYIYIADAARAVCEVGYHAHASGIFNLGSGDARPLRSIVELIRDKIDPQLYLGFGEIPYRADQVMHLEADISKLTDATRWTPQVGLEEGIERTIAYYRKGDHRVS